MWTEELAERAKADTDRRKQVYSKEIKKSIENSTISYYEDTSDVKPKWNNMCIRIEQEGSVETLVDVVDTNSGKKVAVLNFASFKNPGGAYMGGAMAQEEALCHASTLYNIISDAKFVNGFYEPNKSLLNKGRYTDRHIYVKDVLFEYKAQVIYPVDVITCAAPNKSYAFNANDAVLAKEIDTVMFKRIDQILYSAYRNDVDILILGAFGCGVFKNNPNVVAKAFNDLLQSKYQGAFKEVVFAIPPGRKQRDFKSVADKNLAAFIQNIKAQ